MYTRRRSFGRLFLVLSVLLVLAPTVIFAAGKVESEAADGEIPGLKAEPTEGEDYGYLDLFQGLHITGTPADIDIETFELKIEGKVGNPVGFSFSEIKEMPSERREIALVCPGFFVDRGYWTGVPLRVFLDEAEVASDAERVVFIEEGGGYSSTLPLERAKADGVMVAYHFDDEEFHKVHGYPVRLVAEGADGNVWVKWLGTIRIE
jgi:DMSO/TMAO reductase YedYZ molybdopterin-dependent catalytic subunit